MGMNFHPRVLGQMLWKDGRNGELAMLHNAVFDPLVTDLRRQYTPVCTVPCHKNFRSVFQREVEEATKEWSGYHGTSEHLRAHHDLPETAATNRSLKNFFRGAFGYHIHNQVSGFRIGGTKDPLLTEW